jgi:exopolysaccharide production protein ExoY
VGTLPRENLSGLPLAGGAFDSPLSWAERAGCGFLLAGLAPVLFLTGIAVRMLSGQTPLVAHCRVGYRGRPLWMLKFRTMWERRGYGKGLVERLTDRLVPHDKSEPDPRVTHPFARFLRRYSIDELPQLWLVVKGEMALVGPRPLTAVELDEHYGAAADEILQVKPGITGLWQVMGRNRLTYSQRRRLDLFLVRRRSLRLYGLILWRTIPVVVTGENAG